MANQWLNTNWVSMEILRLLLNKLTVAEAFDTSYEKDFEREYAVGSTITVKFPWRPLVIDGMQYNPQAVQRVSTTISLDQWLQIPFEWDDYERAVRLERSEAELRKNYWEPCGAAMAQEWDSRAALHAKNNASNVVGSGTAGLGTDPTTLDAFFWARQRLEEEACPPDGKRYMIVSSSMMRSLGGATGTGSVLSMFHADDEITRLFKRGSIGTLAGFSWFESNSLWSHTAGTWASAVNVVGAGQSGASIVIKGTAADTIKAGDKISFVNVNATNPMTRRIAGKAAVRTFTVPQDYTLTGGNDTISILPALYGPGSPYQNVDSLPVNNAALTLWPGTGTPNGKVGTVALALSRYAFALVGAKLYLPKAVESAGQANDLDSGIGVRKVIAWDPVRSMQVNRFDSLGGFGNLYQSNGACCVCGS